MTEGSPSLPGGSCSHCGRHFEAGDRYCRACGASLEGASDDAPRLGTLRRMTQATLGIPARRADADASSSTPSPNESVPQRDGAMLAPESAQSIAHSARVSRRRALTMVTRIGGAAAALAAIGWAVIQTRGRNEPDSGRSPGGEAEPAARRQNTLPFLTTFQPEPLDDTMFAPATVEAGAWLPGPYGPDDQRGSFNEVTPEKTAEALRLLDSSRPVVTYNLGELMYNGFPSLALPSPRIWDQTMMVVGFQPPAGTNVILEGAEPIGPNRLIAMEERFPRGYTYHMGTLIPSLNHIGVGSVFYNGFKATDIVRSWGTTALGLDHMGPIVTRGILLDIIGLKVAQGETSAYFTVSSGAPVLQDTYRVTIEDIESAMKRAGITEMRPGDVIFLRMGWTQLIKADPQRYLAGEPGPYLKETRYLAARRPAIVGTDNWAVELLDPAVTQGNVFPCHQVLNVRNGIRVGENIVMDQLAEDGIAEFVFILTPPYVQGATTSNNPPIALAQPRR